MKVLLTTLREPSHFLALKPFLSALQRGGHEVAVAAPVDFAERVEATGATFFVFGHPGDEGLKPTWARMREVSGDDLRRMAHGELFAGVCAGAAIPALIETIERWRPSVVARESHEFAGLVAAEKVGVPHLRVAICAAGAEDEIRSCAAPFVDAHRRSGGLPPDPEGDRIRTETAITLFPRSFDSIEPSAPVLRFRSPRREAPPLPDWWSGARGPLVYMTLGTVTGRFEAMRATYRAMIDAVVDRPIRALLTIGASLPLEALGDVPSNVHVERFVPQDDVIPHASAVVCHGGSGTVLSTLAAGVPMVVIPLFADQPHNAERVAALGGGLGDPSGGRSLRGAPRRGVAHSRRRVVSTGGARDRAGDPCAPAHRRGGHLDRAADALLAHAPGARSWRTLLAHKLLESWAVAKRSPVVSIGLRVVRRVLEGARQVAAQPGVKTMRFMIMHKNDALTEAGQPPPMELVTRMGAFIGEYAKAGRFLDGAGLSGSKTRTRLVFRDGRATVKHGPYRGEHELPAAMLLLKVRTRDEAIGWAERYGKILGDGELELGKVNEPWDIGLMPPPENPPLQILLIEKAEPATEAGGRSSKQKADLTRLKTEMTKAGVLVRSLPLKPSATARRLVFTSNDLRVLDGPFAESKELIGGFAVMELSDMDEAMALCRRYAEILGGTLEIDVRVVDPDAD